MSRPTPPRQGNRGRRHDTVSTQTAAPDRNQDGHWIWDVGWIERHPGNRFLGGVGMSAWLIGLVTFIYLGVSIGYALDGRNGMAFTFVGYALANIGLIWDAVER